MTARAGLFRPAGLLLAALVLAGCAGGNVGQRAELQIVQAMGAAAQKAAAGKPPDRPPLTREALKTVTISAIEVTLERRGVQAYLFLDTVRRDDGPGLITVWRSEDNATLATRNGVVIATRGLGNDLLSSSVPVRGDSPGPAGSGEHVQMISGLDNKELRLALECELRDLGPEPVEIVELVHPTRRLQERCEGPGGGIINDYWVDDRSGIVWQSRQWAGPGIGYLRIRRLVNRPIGRN